MAKNSKFREALRLIKDAHVEERIIEIECTKRPATLWINDCGIPIGGFPSKVYKLIFTIKEEDI